MEWGHIFQAVFSLIFVIGLLLLTLWAFKYCELKGLNSRLMKSFKANQRIEIVELRRIDAKNSAVLIRRDNIETLVLLGAAQNLILEQNISAPKGLETND